MVVVVVAVVFVAAVSSLLCLLSCCAVVCCCSCCVDVAVVVVWNRRQSGRASLPSALRFSPALSLEIALTAMAAYRDAKTPPSEEGGVVSERHSEPEHPPQGGTAHRVGHQDGSW